MRVGIIGLGNMGGRMAKRLLEQDVEVGVFDINKDFIQTAVKLGAEEAESPADLALKYEYVITVLPNVYIVKETLLGPEGLLKTFRPENLLIEMTTSIPSVTKELSNILKNKGLRMIDAPVSGGVKKAEDGLLSIMVGGEVADFEEVKPLLSCIGQNLFHVGDAGAGHTIKALNNMISATT
ncbi:NAD(P)-dependent oxidoreductase [Paenisporosarcina sp. TG20]|uniref:NAD(P)-dependent oxidoreductase n=1 Tax=Paenisporosarcina sp. TG20 TaxID=1211706 RepID=UPI0002D94CF4|nr:NAD(P)-dependent oxidoreductase [Paenisporosarcina sp. TG20]